MQPTDRPRRKSSSPRVERPAGRSITPMFPLLLLETMRDRDRPDEFLEDEDVAVSLPRRLGLSEVVRVQISRFEEEVQKRRLQTADQVEDLIRLVIRRPDAEEIFEEAGRRMAQHSWQKRSAATRGMIRALPRPLALLAAHRATKRLFGRLAGNGQLSVGRWPVELRLHGSLSASADPGGAACAFYAGVFTELLQQYTGRVYKVQHSACETRGGRECEWTVQIAS